MGAAIALHERAKAKTEISGLDMANQYVTVLASAVSHTFLVRPGIVGLRPGLWIGRVLSA